MLTETENQIRAIITIENIVQSSNKENYILIDGDRTFTPVDSTKSFFEHIDLNILDIKSVFRENGYSFDAFYKVAQIYSKIDKTSYENACYSGAKNIQVYPEFIDFVNILKNQAEIILITSGVRDCWQNILNNHGLNFMKIIGGNYLPNDSFIVDKGAKGVITRTLVSKNKNVIAFGDTEIDLEMLQSAHFPFLVFNEKKNKDLINKVVSIPNIKQISFLNEYHPNLVISNLVEIINTIKQIKQTL